MADVYFTRRAMQDIKSILYYSEEQWGARVARTYLEDVYSALKQTAKSPQRGKLRQRRAAPYLMVPVGKHFAVYEIINSGIIIATILHGRRDIESIIQSLGPELAAEVIQVRKQINN